MVAAVAISGRLDFNPITDSLVNEEGDEVKLDPPTGLELPQKDLMLRIMDIWHR